MVRVNAGPPAVSVNPDAGLEWAALQIPRRVPFDGTSYLAVAAALEKIFGPFPIRLSDKLGHNLALRAMEAAAGEGGFAYGNLAAAIEKHEEIEVRKTP